METVVHVIYFKNEDRVRLSFAKYEVIRETQRGGHIWWEEVERLIDKWGYERSIKTVGGSETWRADVRMCTADEIRRIARDQGK